MNKKLYGSLAVIALLVAYIIFSNQKGTRDVPELEPWKGEVTELVMKSGEKEFHFTRTEGKWFIGKEKYPADERKVKNLVKKVRDLKLTDLISRQKFYRNYDLQPEKASTVILKKDKKVVRKLKVGKTGATGRHSYLLVDDHPEVYQGAVTFKGDLNRTVNDYRDKVIMKVSRDAVTSIAVTFRGRTFAFDQEKIQHKKKPAKPESTVQKPVVPQKSKTKWVYQANRKLAVKKAKVDALVNALNPLRASSYSDVKKDTLRMPRVLVKVKAFGRDIDLKIFRQQKDKKYLATSSESPWVFTLDEWRAKKYFIENLNDFRDNK